MTIFDKTRCAYRGRILLLTCAAVLASGLANSARAVAIAPGDHPFEVEVPKDPEQREVSRSIGFGTVESRSFVVNDEKGTIFVSIITIPGFASAFTPNSLLYGQTKDGMISDLQAKELEFSDFERDGREGKLLVYEIPASEAGQSRQGRAEFFRVGKQMYLFAAHSPQDEPSQRDEFFASLRLKD